MNTYDETQCTHGYVEARVIFGRDNGELQLAERGATFVVGNFKSERCLKNCGEKKNPKRLQQTHNASHSDLSGFPAAHRQPTS